MSTSASTLARLTRRDLHGLMAAMLLGVACSAAAQSYPIRPLKLVLGFPPGGAADGAARQLAEQLAVQVGQPVIVENRPGASGNIAAANVARSPADGYRLFFGTNTTHAANATLYPKLEFDPVKDFEPVVMTMHVWNVLAVNPDFPATNLREFLAQAMARPGTINVATPGNATSPHMSLELLKTMADVELTHVPYKGSAFALTNVMGGQVPAIFDNLPASLALIKAGKIRALAVSSPQRLEVLPDVPTFDEAGIKGYEVSGWGAIWVPAGTPQAIVQRLNMELNAALKAPRVLRVMADNAMQPGGGTAASAADFARAETIKWRDVIRRAGIKLQ